MQTESTWHESEDRYMQRALALAERGRGLVEPNPLVGAVVVHDNVVVAEGWHQKYGEAHAEVNALRAAGDDARGATLYVTLEPCCHHGKTPPCTEAIRAAGITRVVAAMSDPFPQVAGEGGRRLEQAGIACQFGLGEADARRLNAPYLKLLATGRPYVHAKWAMTLDGKIASRAGDSKWISGEESRRRAHLLRGRMDALLIGVGTALADDPLLTARPPGPRVATRIVLDSQGRLPITSQLVRSASAAPVLVVTTTSSPTVNELEKRGCEVLPLPGSRPAIDDLLQELGRRRMTNVLVEGGAEVLGSFLDADAIDEVHIYLAPLLLGGRAARTPIGGEGIAKLVDALRLTHWRPEIIEPDVFIHGWR